MCSSIRTARPGRARNFIFRLLSFLAFALCPVTMPAVRAQAIQRELDTPEKVEVFIANRNGRVSVIAAEDQKKVVVNASSTGAVVAAGDVRTTVKGNSVDID